MPLKWQKVVKDIFINAKENWASDYAKFLPIGATIFNK
jgi:hypothetical protein